MNRFVRGNSDTCIGCRTCMIGCVVSHEGIDMFRAEQGEYVFNPKLDIVKTPTISIAVQCKHCENPACLNACPVSAIGKVNGAVIIDSEKCIGCKTCMIACPYGAINMVANKKGVTAANKCDLCASKNFEPECVKVCLTNSLMLVTEEDVAESNNCKRVSAAVQLSQLNKQEG